MIGALIEAAAAAVAIAVICVVDLRKAEIGGWVRTKIRRVKRSAPRLGE